MRPAADPMVIAVGGADPHGTLTTADDTAAVDAVFGEGSLGKTIDLVSGKVGAIGVREGGDIAEVDVEVEIGICTGIGAIDSDGGSAAGTIEAALGVEREGAGTDGGLGSGAGGGAIGRGGVVAPDGAGGGFVDEAGDDVDVNLGAQGVVNDGGGSDGFAISGGEFVPGEWAAGGTGAIGDGEG